MDGRQASVRQLHFNRLEWLPIPGGNEQDAGQSRQWIHCFFIGSK